MVAEELERAKSYVLWLLARRNYSQFQLERKLKIRGLKPEESQQLLRELKERGFFNERSYIQARIRQFIRKGLGSKAIEGKMRAEKAPATKEEIKEAFLELGKDEESELKELVQKTLEKLSQRGITTERELKNRLVQTLFKKGHAPSAVLSHYKNSRKS